MSGSNRIVRRGGKDRCVLRLLHLQTDSRPDSLGNARRAVRRAVVQAGIDLDVASDMEVAVGEALSNTYRHAYREDVGPVQVEVRLTETALTVIICDDGCAAVAPTVPRTVPTRREPGGRGLYLASRLADDLRVQVNSAGRGLMICLTKRFPPGAVARPDRRRRYEGDRPHDVH